MPQHYIDNLISYLSANDFLFSYKEGLMQRALIDLYDSTNKEKYYNYSLKYYQEFMKALEDKRLAFNDDLFFVACSLFSLYEYNEDAKILITIEKLKNELNRFSFDQQGLFNLAQDQAYLDSQLKMLLFLIDYANFKKDEALFGDLKTRLINIKNVFYVKSKKLYKINAQGDAIYWLGAMGLLAKVLVEYLCFKKDEVVQNIFNELIDGLENHLKNDIWTSLITDENDDIYYEDLSSTLLLSYSYIKAYQLSILSPKYYIKALDIFKSIKLKYFLEVKESWHLTNIVEPLFKEASDKVKKETYYKEDGQDDNIYGVAPFILVYNQLKRIQK